MSRWVGLRVELTQLVRFGPGRYFPALWEDLRRRWRRRNWD